MPKFIRKRTIELLYMIKRKELIIENEIGKFLIYSDNDSIEKSSESFEFETQKWITATDNTKRLFVDIGTNIGFYTIYALNRCGYAEGLCFEANPSTYELFQKNMMLNQLQQRVRGFNVGLSDRNEKIDFYQKLIHTGGSRFVEKDMRHKIKRRHYILHKLETRKFDDIAQEEDFDPQKIGYIKIDVEGFELNVLKGMRETLDLLQEGTRIFVEINHNNPVEEYLQRHRFKKLEQIGKNHLFIKVKNE